MKNVTISQNKDNKNVVSEIFKTAAIKKLFGFVAVTMLFFVSQQSYSQCASDNASNAAYTGGNMNGQNGGSGFTAWTANPTSNGSNQGSFTGTSDANSQINNGTKVWGIYSNTDAISEVIRPFTTLSVGNTISFAIDNGTITNSKSVGFTLQNSTGGTLMEIFLLGGGTQYQVNRSGGATSSGVNYTTLGLNITITYTSTVGNGTFSADITPIGGTKVTTTGTFISSGAPTRARFFNFNAGSGGGANFYFNNLSTGTAAPSLAVVDNCNNTSTLTVTGATGILAFSGPSTPTLVSGSTYTVPTAGNYTVKQTVNGCESAASNQVTAAPKTPPNPPLLSVVNNCGTSTITAKDAANANIPSGELIWSNGSTGNPISVNNTTAVTATRTVTGCTSASSTQIVPAPKTTPAAPTASNTTNNGPVCAGTTLSLSTTISADSYAWTGPNGFTSSLQNPTVSTSATDAMGGTYSLRVTVNGCQSAAGTTAATVKSLLDFVNLQFPATSTICQGTSFTAFGQVFEPGVTPGAGQSTASASNIAAQIGYSTSNTDPSGTGWTWINAPFNSGQTTNTANNDEFVGTLSGLGANTYFYAFRYSYNGCAYQYGGTTGTWNNNSGVLTVNPIPTKPTLTVVNNCGISTLTVSDFTGSLTFSGPSTPTGSGNTYTVTTGGDYSVKQSVNGCISEASTSVNAAPLAVLSKPTLTIANTCQGVSTITVGNATGALTWTGPSSPTLVSANTYTVSTVGSYSVQQTATNGCISPASDAVNAVIVDPASFAVSSNFGSFASAALVNNTYYNTRTLTGNPSAIGSVNFNTGSLGTAAASSGGLIFKGGQIKTFKNNGGNACGGFVNYRVYPQGTAVGSRPAFSQTPLNYLDECPGSNFPSSFPSGGPCVAGDQKWQSALELDLTAGRCAGTYEIELYYDITGNNSGGLACGITLKDNNCTNYIQSFTITDTTAPVITTCATAQSASANGSCQATVPTFTGVVATDNCTASNALVITQSPAAGTVVSTGVTNVTITVKDAANNSSTCSTTFTVTDTTAPTITCPDNISVNNDAGNCSAVVNFSASATDNCSTPVITYSTASGSAFPVGITTVTATAKDAANNSSSCQFTVTVTDTEKPKITCPDEITTVTGQTTAYAVIPSLGTPTVSDNCPGVTYSNDAPANNQYPIGATIVKWTATDAKGLTATCDQTIIVNDLIQPDITCNTAISINNTLAQCNGNTAVTYPAATDNSGQVSISSNYSGLSSTSVNPTTPLTVSSVQFPVGATTIVWTAKDPSDNQSQCSQTVTVTDNEKPTITCPAAVNQYNDAGNCSAVISLATPSTNDNCGVHSVTNDHPSTTFLVGTTTVKWTVTDIHGNTNTCNQTVIVTDHQAPAVPVIANATGECSVTVTAPTTTDVCKGLITGTTTDPISYTSQGNYTIHWTFDDGNGNSSTANQTVIVKDVTAPVTPTLADVTGECLATAPTPTTTDACVGNITGTTSDALNYTLQGSYVIHWIFEDSNGNATTANQNVIVDDQTAPVVDAPIVSGVPTFATATGECSVTVTTPSAEDACTGTITGTTLDQTTYTTQGTYTVHWSFYDGNGNVSSALQTVIVDDVTAPATPILADVTGECSAAATAPTTIDNCSGTITGTTSDALSYSAQGTHIIHWTFDDGNGNSTTSNQNVIVDDVTAPATPTLADVTGECSAAATAPTTIDNCSGTITGTTSDALSYSTQGTHVIHWTFDDGNGNATTANQNVIVDDVTDPVTPTLADVTGECSATATTATTTDVCVGTITGTTSDDLSYSTQGTHVIHWSFDDGNGNTTTANQNVIVDDVTAPATPTLADVTGECSAAATAPTTTDNCSGTITGTTSDALSYSTQGTHVIHWTFDDGNGNAITANQNVIVDDVTAPATPTLADVTGECSAAATAPTTIDNCSGTITGTTSDALSYSAQGTYVVHWTFDDGNGNATTANQNVIVDDVTAPAIPTLADVTGECSAAATAPTTSDNCSGTITGTTSTAFPITALGTTVITWTFDDSNGNNTTANQNVIVTKPAAPAGLACYQSVTFNTGTCSWDITGTQPAAPPVLCYQTATWNPTSCRYDITGIPPALTTTGSVTQSQCGGTYTWPVNGVTYSSSTTQTVVSGCNDSNTATLNLTITAPTTLGSESVSVCGTSYTWPLNGQSYTTSGSYTHVVGCNTATLNLTIMPCPVDCVVSAWSDWTAWSTEACGVTATRTKTRTVTTAAAYGGIACGPLTETETRTNAPCPVDCVVSAWSAWSAWSTSCVSTSTRTRTRTIITPASNGGTACGALTETETRNNIPVSASFTTNNSWLYYGYSGDQTATIKVRPSGGTGTYKVVITMDRPLKYNYINSTGDEMLTASSGGVITNNIQPAGCSTLAAGCNGVDAPTITFTGVVANTIVSINFTLLQDAGFSVTVTDANICSITKSVLTGETAAVIMGVNGRIDAEDVRCFAGNSNVQKVTICHRTGSTKNPCVTICVDASAIEEHLAHGDYMGNCQPNCVAPVSNAKQIEEEVVELNPFKVTAYPNPTSSQFTLLVEGGLKEKVEVLVYDMLARLVKRIEKTDGQPIQFGEELPRGEYLTVVKQGENMKAVNLIKK